MIVWPQKAAPTVATPIVRVVQTPTRIEADNGIVKARFQVVGDGIEQAYFARRAGEWVLIAEAFRPPKPYPPQAAKLYDTSLDPEHRLLVPAALRSLRVETQTDDLARILLTGSAGGHAIEQTVELGRAQDHFHIEVRAELAGSPPKLEYLISPFVAEMAGTPDVTHAPALKRTANDLIGDRIFFSPTALAQKGGTFIALAPDLDAINADVVYAKDARQQTHPKLFAVSVDPNRVSMPTALDLELQSGLTEKPLLTYGVWDFVADQHVYWRHDSEKGALVRALSSRTVLYGLDLFVKADAPAYQGYRRVSRYLWERYGARYFRRPKPQAMPFAEYAKVCYPASFAYKGYEVGKGEVIQRDPNGPAEWDSWQQWEMNGLPVGGIRLSAPQWFHLTCNSAWWNNVCDATGFYYWGKALHDPSLLDKARRVVNLALSAPQKDGLFPAIYDLNQHGWVNGFWKFPAQGYDPNAARTYWDWQNGDYQTAAASVTAGYLLEYRRVCEDIPEILPYVRRYGDFLVTHIQANGCVPAWFNADLRPLPSMRWNADGGAHIWVLSELYRATKEAKYLEAAKRLARFMMQEVLPQQKWSDFEAFYSCAVKPETYHDPHTGQPARCTMSMSWALEGFAALYEVTHDRASLEAAEATADYACLYQTVWAPHYIITAYPFGGFSSQVGDAEWLDQRSHRFAGALVRIGLLSGRQDLLERGIAAARSSLTLVNLPCHLANGIYSFPNYPFGLGPENIDHEGFPQMPLRSGASWCEVGGLAAAADIMRQLGGAYVNCREHLAVGVDGVEVCRFGVTGGAVDVEMESLVGALPEPYRRPYEIELRVVEPDGKRRTKDVLIRPALTQAVVE